MSCGMDADRYGTLTTHKIAVARYHLGEFERLVREGSSSLPGADPETTYAPLHGHADGAVFEAFAAFDSFSCAIAHKYGVARADRASFTEIGGDSHVPFEIARRVTDTVATDRWQRLTHLRNLAGHRGVVSQHLVWGTHLPGGFQVFLPHDSEPGQRGDEFMPVARDLLGWSEGRLRVLFNGVCERAFTRRGRILQLHGSQIRAEILDG